MPNFTTEPSIFRTVRFWLIAVVVTIIATYLLTVRYVDSQLAQRNDNNIINDCHKVDIHFDTLSTLGKSELNRRNRVCII